MRKDQRLFTLLAGKILLILSLSCFLSCRNHELPSPTKSNQHPPVILAHNEVYGYTDKQSYFPGDTIRFYLSTAKDTVFNGILNITDINYNTIWQVTCDTVFKQTINSNEPWQNGYGFKTSTTAVIPDNMPSGVYLFADDYQFVVKSTTAAAITIVYPSNTENAYCTSGGKCLYYDAKTRSAQDRARIVSFLRPIPLTYFARAFLQWVVNEPYNIRYITDQDMDDSSSFNNTSLFIIPGHSEYWTRKARRNFDNFVAKGKSALLLSGNNMWWQVRYADNNTQLICYRYANEDTEVPDSVKTVNWESPILRYPILPSIGENWLYGGYGQPSRGDKQGFNGYKIIDASSPLLTGTGLKNGDTLYNPTDEYDGLPIIGIYSKNDSPIINRSLLPYYKIKIIGYDFTNRTASSLEGSGTSKGSGVAALIIFQRMEHSGIVINAASTNWCTMDGAGGKEGNILKKITSNMLYDLLHTYLLFKP